MAASSPALHPAPLRQLWGYYPWWLRDAWRELEIGRYDRVSLFEFVVGENGQVLDLRGWPGRWTGLMQAVRGAGGQVEVTVFLDDARRFERIFTSASLRSEWVAALLALARPADALQLDVEIYAPLSAASVRGYHEAVGRLRAQLGELPPLRPGWPAGRSLGRSLTAFAPVGAATELYGGALAEGVDQLVVQGYDYHHAASAHAGPVAPLRGPYTLTWERSLRHFRSLGWPAGRLLFSVPFFGYEWPTQSGEPGAAVRGGGREITYAPVDAGLLPDIRIDALTQAARHGLHRDPASGSPCYVRRDADGWWQGWFEDEVSLAAKLEFVRHEGLAGLAVFAIGYDAGRLDAGLRRRLSASARTVDDARRRGPAGPARS